MSFITLSSPQQELFFSDLFSAFARNIQLEIYGTEEYDEIKIRLEIRKTDTMNFHFTYYILNISGTRVFLSVEKNFFSRENVSTFRCLLFI